MGLNTILIPPANFGAITVDITPPTEETAVDNSNSTNARVTIPAGQRYVKIYNAGAIFPGDIEEDMTVNGTDYPVGFTLYFNQIYKEDEQKVLTSPEYEIDGNGSRVFYEYYQ